MPPKRPQQSGGGGNKSQPASKGKKKGGNDIGQAEEDPLVAVVLADSYNSRFSPLTLDKPRCLLPLLNAPMIDWTLEALALAGVEHTYVLARAHVELIREHISGRLDANYITVIATPEARSQGDALRELDGKQLIKSDFLLVHADGVGNMDLKEIIRIHKERRKADKDAIMTMCAMPTASGSRTRPYGDQAVFCLEPFSSQLLHYEAVPAIPRKGGVTLPAILFDEKEGHSEVEMRSDLVDSGIDVCSVDVPPLFSENFDYQDLRRDFMTGILTSDLLESKIFVHVAPAAPHSADAAGEGSLWMPRRGKGWGYAARVKDTQSYDAISKDILARWLAPLGPGGNMPGSNQGSSTGYLNRHSVKSGLRYTGENVHLSRSCVIGNGTLIGPGSQIKERAKIVRSVIGAGCVIEDDAEIVDSYIWDGSKIGKGARVTQSIIGEKVTLLEGAEICKGTLIAKDCTIGKNVRLPPLSRVAKISFADAKLTEDEDDDFQTAPTIGTEAGAETSSAAASSSLGEGGVGFLWPVRGQEGEEDESDYDEDDVIEDPRNVSILQLGASLQEVQLWDNESELSSIEADSELGDDDDEDGASVVSSATSRSALKASGGAAAAGDISRDGKAADSTAMTESLTLSGTGASAGEKAAAHQRLLDFQNEALASLKRAFEEGHTISNIAIELKTLRMASNVPPKEVCAIVVAFVLSRCDASRPKELLEIMDRWGRLIAGVASDDEIEALSVMQSYCAAHATTHGRLFVPLLKKWYNDDIVTEEGILEWYKSPRSSKPSSSSAELLNLNEDGTRSKGKDEETMQMDLQTLLELKKQAHDVIRFILEDSDDEEEEEEESEEEEE